MKNHQDHIKKAYQLAQSAQEHGNHPFGALLVVDGEVVLSSENTVISDNDITRHAELNLVSLATQKFTTKILKKAILYASTEPCAMCAGAIFWSGISCIAYGCSAKKLGEVATGSFVVPCRDVFKYGNREVAVIGPLLEAQGADIHRGFWK